MGNTALLLKAAGMRVSGADTGVYPPMSDLLRENTIEIFEGYDAERLAALAPDLVVVGNATVRGNPEFEWLLAEKKIPFISLPALIHDRLLAGRQNIVIAGTHGKTTTATLTALLLRANGADPGFLIGGVPIDLPSGAELGGTGAPFVIEGDEYDSALFDKRSKFIHYAPHVAVVNNIEFDHADIFRDLRDVQRSFNHFLKIVPRNGWIIVNGDDPNIAALDPVTWAPVCRVGVGEANDLRIADFGEDCAGARFRLIWKKQPWTQVRWAAGGLFNARNAAMAALAAALTARPDAVTSLDLSALADYHGVKRRQERRAERDGLVVIEDFGHHPTALGNTLESLRTRYPRRRITAVFEPRTNTTRTNYLQRELIDALSHAHEVYLGPVHRPEKLRDDERLDLDRVVAELRKKGGEAAHFPSNAALLEDLQARTLEPSGEGERAARTVVFFSNGAFDGIIGVYADAVARLTEAKERTE